MPPVSSHVHYSLPSICIHTEERTTHSFSVSGYLYVLFSWSTSTMTSSFQLDEGLSENDPHSWKCHKKCCIFQMVSTWVTPSFGQMLMVHCCTNHSIIWNSDLYPLHYLTGRLPVTRLCGGGKNTSMYMKVPYTSPLDDTYCASFLYAAIIKDWYFLAHLVHRHWYDERLSAPSHGSPDLKESIAP